LLWKKGKRKTDTVEDQAAELFCGDSWFLSVTLAKQLAKRGHNCVGALKTNTKCFPKVELEENMKDFPSGSCLVLECQPPGDDCALLAIGHKHNSRKTLSFVATKDA